MSNDPSSGGDQHGRHGQAAYPGAYGQPGDPSAYPGAYGSHADQSGQGYPGYQATQQAGYGQPPPSWAAQGAAPQQPAWQGGQPAGSGPGGIGQQPPSGGLFGALFDFSFSSFATPVVTRALYVLGLVVIGLVYLFAVIASFLQSALSGLLVLVLGGIVALFYLILLRVALELNFAVVRMSEDLRTLRDRG